MADEELVVKASIDDELSTPLKELREDVRAVGEEADRASGRASRGSRGWDLYGRASEKAGKLAHTAGRLIRGAAIAVGAGIAATAYAAGRLAKSSIQQASDLAESLNAVNVTYGKQAGAVKKLGREAAKSIGLSNVEFNGMAVQFSAFATAIGGQGAGAVKTLDNITKRAADFASVMNIEVAEAAALFQSGLAGETEPLRKYGIDLSAAAVTAHAYKVGIAEAGEELTENQKVQARYSSVMEQTQKTHKDFTNTSDSLANQQRILGARFDNAQAKLGRGLLPIMQKGAQWLNREGVPAFLRFSDWFNDEGLPAIGRFVDKARTFYEKHGPQIRDTLDDVRTVARQAADAAGDLVEAFLNMPSWARKLLVGGLAGGVIAKKTGVYGFAKSLGKGAGGLAGLASKAKPLPVFVVNNGIPGTGGPGGGPGKPGGPKPVPFIAKPGVASRVATAAPKALGVTAGGLAGAGLIEMFLDGVQTEQAIDAAKQQGASDVAELAKFINTKQTEIAGLQQTLAAGMSSNPAGVEAAIKAAEDDLHTLQYRFDELSTVSIPQYKQGLAMLPEDVRTQVSTPGALDSQEEVRKLLHRLDLTPAEKFTAIALTGVPVTMDELTRIQTYLANLRDKTIRVAVEARMTNINSGFGLVDDFPATTTPRTAPRGGGNGNGNGDNPPPPPPPRVTPRTSSRTGALPPAPRAAGGGDTLTIEDGAIRVDARNASSDVDVEHAVARGIEKWERERKERK